MDSVSKTCMSASPLIYCSMIQFKDTLQWYSSIIQLHWYSSTVIPLKKEHVYLQEKLLGSVPFFEGYYLHLHTQYNLSDHYNRWSVKEQFRIV